MSRKIYLVVGAVEYEGSQTLLAFESEKNAELARELLAKHKDQEPRMARDSEEYEEWSTKFDAWMKARPFGITSFDDFYNIQEMELRP